MSDFKVLSDREFSLQRPGVYIGKVVAEEQEGIIDYKWSKKTIVPGLIKLVEEVYQNSIDEYIRTEGKFANRISIDIKQSVSGCSISVEDNGRGIPVKEIDGKWQPEIAWTTLRAGSNFDDSKRVGAGTNGMGSALVNIFSTSFVGTTCDGTKKCEVICSDNMANINVVISKGTRQGTKVVFEPDLSRFGIETFDQDHIDVIVDRVHNLAISYPGINFFLDGEHVKLKNLKQIAEKFSEHAIAEQHENVSFVIAPSGVDEEFRILSYVNGIYVKSGGSHVDFIVNKLVDKTREVIKKKHKLDVLPNQVRQHLLFASWITRFPNLQFDSQTKERITNPAADSSKFFDGIDFEKIAKKVVNTPEIIDPIVDALLRKREAQEAAEERRRQKDLSKTNLRKISKFTDASDKINRDQCMLFICEGLSAANSILSARTSLIGCYPLKGKPINALSSTNREMLENKEFADFLAITGLQIGQKVRSNADIRFGKIVVCTDADPDGAGHIFGLLTAMIRHYWPELIELGLLYKFATPVLKVQQGKKEILFNTLVEFKAWEEKNDKPFTTRYLKGLGSSTAADFKGYFENMKDNLIQVTIDSIADLEIVDLVFGKTVGSSDRRKEWLGLEE